MAVYSMNECNSLLTHSKIAVELKSKINHTVCLQSVSNVCVKKVSSCDLTELTALAKFLAEVEISVI